MQTIYAADVFARLPKRTADSNKGSFGRVAAVAGSLQYRGAAALCCEGALRCGAGLVYLAAVEPVLQLVLTRTPECCALPCQTAPDGGITTEDAEAARRQFAESPAVLLAGPGLGGSAKRLLPVLLCAPWRAAVLDADALNALAAGTPGRLPPPLSRTSGPTKTMRSLFRAAACSTRADASSPLPPTTPIRSLRLAEAVSTAVRRA